MNVFLALWKREFLDYSISTVVEMGWAGTKKKKFSSRSVGWALPTDYIPTTQGFQLIITLDSQNQKLHQPHPTNQSNLPPD